MMTATGKKLQALEISQNGAPITVLDQHKGVFMFALNGQSYTIRISGLFGRSYELRRGDEMLASAEGETFRDRTTVTFGDKVWLLKAENIRNACFGLYDGATRLGGITSGDGGAPVGWRHHRPARRAAAGRAAVPDFDRAVQVGRAKQLLIHGESRYPFPLSSGC